jgi:HPt (histidine-containing phosphotransfer) domain-containing protein
MPEAAHKLKCGARSIGALALRELCAAVETAAATGGTSASEALRAGLDGAQRAVQAFRDDRQAAADA